MKNFFAFVAAVITFTLVPAFALAAGNALVNGGLGQSAGNVSNFGLAVCNHGTTKILQPATLTVTVNGQIANISSPSPVSAGACAYTYIPYAQFNMEAGISYDVTVALDGGNPSTYSVTVPGTPPATQAPATQTANTSAQSGGFFRMIVDWFANLFKGF